MIGAGSLMMLIPYSMIPYAGFACAFVAFISAYFYRWRYKNKDEMMVFHMNYLIKSVWIANLILIVGIIIFGSIIFSNGDMSAIHAMMASAEKGVIPNEGDILAMQLSFLYANKALILMAAVIGLLPYPLYLISRIFKGVRILIKKEG
jgi:uncharacterized membrane protein